MADRTLCFDMILCAKSSGGFNPMSVEELLTLSITERLALIRERRLKFFRGEEEVPVFDAIKSLHA